MSFIDLQATGQTSSNLKADHFNENGIVVVVAEAAGSGGGGGSGSGPT